MKITILKRITSLLMILGLVGILVTSCERESVIQSENQDYSELSKEISGNQDFQKIVDIKIAIRNDFTEFHLSNEELIKNDPSIMENFTASYEKFEEEFINHNKNLYKTFPELEKMEQDNFVIVYEEAYSEYISSKENLQERNPCYQACNSNYLVCDAWCQFVFQSNNYSAYKLCNRGCALTYFACVGNCN